MRVVPNIPLSANKLRQRIDHQFHRFAPRCSAGATLALLVQPNQRRARARQRQAARISIFGRIAAPSVAPRAPAPCFDLLRTPHLGRTAAPDIVLAQHMHQGRGRKT